MKAGSGEKTVLNLNKKITLFKNGFLIICSIKTFVTIENNLYEKEGIFDFKYRNPRAEPQPGLKVSIPRPFSSARRNNEGLYRQTDKEWFRALSNEIGRTPWHWKSQVKEEDKMGEKEEWAAAGKRITASYGASSYF